MNETTPDASDLILLVMALTCAWAFMTAAEVSKALVLTWLRGKTVAKLLISDAALALTTQMVAQVPGLTDEERKALFERVHGLVLQALTEYENRAQRLHQRVNP